MREIVLGTDALLTDVLLTAILTVPSGLTDASLTVEFRLGDGLLLDLNK